ncbi:right-handed parallel beta-helix repeat-containing protein, partial [Limnofasciculus baicalensis]
GRNFSSLPTPPIPPNLLTPPTPLPTKGGQLVLVDFGASKFTTRTAISVTGTAIGSKGYTAPEQAAGKSVFASDIYSLGVTCIHLLTKKDPFELYSFDEGIWIWRNYLNSPVSDKLSRIIDKMLEGATNRRYQSVGEVLHDLQESIVSSANLSTLRANPSSSAKIIPELIVAKLGTADYRNIKDAIANAEPGARILVRPGFYRESISIHKPVEIIGDGERDDIIIESKFRPCIAMGAEKGVVKNITLRHYSWSQLQKADLIGSLIGEFLFKPFAIAIPQGQLILENCIIHSTGIASIYIRTAATSPQIRNCQINPGSKYGILVTHNGNGIIEDCDIIGHYIGVEILKGSHPILRRCKIREMKHDGISIAPHSLATIEDCHIFGNGGTGIRIKNNGNATIRRCNINRNQEYGIYVESNGAGPIEQCNLTGNSGDAWYIPPKCSIRRSGNRE